MKSQKKVVQFHFNLYIFSLWNFPVSVLRGKLFNWSEQCNRNFSIVFFYHKLPQAEMDFFFLLKLIIGNSFFSPFSPKQSWLFWYVSIIAKYWLTLKRRYWVIKHWKFENLHDKEDLIKFMVECALFLNATSGL